MSLLPLLPPLCRAVGDYATQAGQGEEGPKRVTAFFKALEAYDYALLQVRLIPFSPFTFCACVSFFQCLSCCRWDGFSFVFPFSPCMLQYLLLLLRRLHLFLPKICVFSLLYTASAAPAGHAFLISLSLARALFLFVFALLLVGASSVIAFPSHPLEPEGQGHGHGECVYQHWILLLCCRAAALRAELMWRLARQS